MVTRIKQSNAIERILVLMLIVWIVISTWGIILWRHVDRNAKIGTASTCVLIAFLDGSARAQQGAIEKQPNSKLNGQRREGIKATKDLRDKLQDTGVHCVTHKN